MRTLTLNTYQANIISSRGVAFRALKAADFSAAKLKSFPLSSPRVSHAIAVYKQLFALADTQPITACGEKTATSTLIHEGLLAIDPDTGLMRLAGALPDTSAIIRTSITRSGDTITLTSGAGEHVTHITLLQPATDAPAVTDAQAVSADAPKAKKRVGQTA